MLLKGALLIPALFFFVCCQRNPTKNDDCLHQLTCGACIQQPGCVWCQNPVDNKTNCAGNTNINEICKKEDKVTVHDSLVIEKDNPLNSDVNYSPFVQIQPQEVSLKIPLKRSHTLQLKFARAQHPLDLYFLVDASYTMKSYKELISQLGARLVDEITKHTTEFRLGFGSFVDKTLSPFSYESDVNSGCSDLECTPGYSFINHLNLTPDAILFEKRVNESKISSNRDPAEGGLEALVQVIACKEEIGWRDNATRMIVLATDDHFHVAGDGRLGGAVFPNDGKCHISKGSTYVKDKETDYPSVSQISYMAEKNEAYIIFAIAKRNTEDKYNANIGKTYENLSKNIYLSKYAVLTQNSNEVIQVIVKTYTDILKSVQMTHDFEPNNFNVKFSVKCPNGIPKGEGCDKIKIGEEVEFHATITPIRCINSTKQYSIKPVGVNEALKINMEVICECECEKKINTLTAVECNGHGNKVCGVCSCNTGYWGKYCHCTSGSTNHTSGGEENCIDPQTNIICNGNGMCKCGQCDCKKDYSGKYCKCNDASCPRAHGQLCGGKDHGICKCGECKCLSDWSGDDCSCPVSKSQCTAPYSAGTPCSGRGECVCGKCKCDEGYFGDFCESCTGCEWCEDLDPCVEAHLSNVPPSEAESLKINCTSVNISDNVTTSSGDTDWKKCLLSRKHGCNKVYKYKFEGSQVLVEIVEEICPFISSPIGILLLILLPIIIGGIIAFLAWKAIVTVKDGREYANFLKKREKEKWNAEGNPLYVPAQREYMNPTFSKQDPNPGDNLGIQRRQKYGTKY